MSNFTHIHISEAEFYRPWMKLAAVELVGPADMPAKWVRNWSDRGLISLANPNPGVRVARLYSLANAVELNILYHLTLCGNTLPFSRQVATLAVDRARNLIRQHGDGPWWQELDEDNSLCLVLTYTTNLRGKVQGVLRRADEVPGIITGASPVPGLNGMEKRAFPLDSLLAWIFVKYEQGVRSGDLDRENASQR